MKPAFKSIQNESTDNFYIDPFDTADHSFVDEHGKKWYVWVDEVSKFEKRFAEMSKIFKQEMEIDWERMKNPDMVTDQIFGQPEWLDALSWISLKKDIQEWKRVVFKNRFQFNHFEK